MGISPRFFMCFLHLKKTFMSNAEKKDSQVEILDLVKDQIERI